MAKVVGQIQIAECRGLLMRLVVTCGIIAGQMSVAAATQIVSATAQPACQTPDALDAFRAVIASGADVDQVMKFAEQRGCTVIPADTKVIFLFPAVAGRYVHVIWMTSDGEALDLWANYDPDDEKMWVNADN